MNLKKSLKLDLAFIYLKLTFNDNEKQPREREREEEIDDNDLSFESISMSCKPHILWETTPVSHHLVVEWEDV